MRMNVILMMIILIAAVQTAGTPKTTSEDRILVVASIETLSLIAKEIGGDKIVVNTILPEEMEPHTFQLTPNVIESIRNASLLILSGHFQFESEILQALSIPHITLEDYGKYDLKLLNIPNNGVNIHGYWLHPKNAMAIARAIMEKLQAIDPKNGEYYSKSFNEFRNKITKLIIYLNESVVEAYGLKWIKAVIASPAAQYITETLQMKSTAFLSKGYGVLISASELARIEEKLKSGEYKIIVTPDIAIKTNIGKYVKQIVRETGTAIAIIKTIGGDFTSYTELIMYNVGVIIGALTNKLEMEASKSTIYTPLEISLIILVLILAIIASIEAWLLMGRI